MEADLRPGQLFHFAATQNMIEVGMGMKQITSSQTKIIQLLFDDFWIAAGVDHHRLAALSVTDDRAVALQGTDLESFKNDHYSNISLTEQSS